MTIHRYDGNVGSQVQNLQLFSEPRFINNAPDVTAYSASFSYSMSGGTFANTADNYGARAFGWFIAPSNGVYRFYVRQDDACELFMNTNRADGMDPAGKVLIAMSTAAGVNYGDMTSGQTVSAGVSLAAGQMYYMEVLLKEGTSNDGFSVAMREQGDSAPLAYQWRKNGVNVPGMTNSGLVLTNVVAGQSGNYDVLAMNSGGFATSAIAVITITGVPPAFVQNPLGTSVVSGETLTLSSLANGTDPVSYQWHANGMPIPGQAARTLVASDVSAAAAGAYFVVASNAYGQATSAIANVTVLLPPQYTLGLSNRVEAAGSGVVLRVAARGAAPMTYTWFHNGLMCQTGSENTLALLNVEPRHSGVYRVVARNGQGTTTSVMTLSVFHPPGAVVAWGDDTGGQSSVPAHLPAVVKVAGGDFHTVALLANGSVKAWGFNGDGQTSQPPGLSNVVGIDRAV